MKLNLKGTAKHAGRAIQMNSPTILTALGVAGVITTGYLAVKAGFQSHQKLEDDRYARGIRRTATEPPPAERTTQEKALLVWKLYIPAVGVGALTIVSIVASNRIQVRRMAALAAGYAVLSGDFDEYRDKARELLGEKKAKDLDDKVAEQKMLNNPPPQGIVIEEGKSWFCDLSTTRYFKSDRQHVEEAINKVNYHLLHSGEMYATLNTAYAFLGLPSTSIGDLLGWTNEQQVEFVPTPVLMPDGAAATGVKLTPEPSPDFDSLH